MEIFINIASYRDPQLIPTIDDCLDKAKYPDRLRFGVLTQDNEPFKYADHKQIKHIGMRPEESKGCGWARNLINSEMYNGEEYFMQVDSHSRFLKNWDDELIKDLTLLGENIALTGYPPHYGLDDKYDDYTTKSPYFTRNVVPKKSNASFSNSKGTVPIEDYEQTLVVSGAFIFSYGMFTIKTLYKDYLNPWMDQEIASCLGHINGYKFFVPKIAKVWHCYNNNNDEKEVFRPLATNDNKITGYITDAIGRIKELSKSDLVDDWSKKLKEL
jgi:hypothetical protein